MGLLLVKVIVVFALCGVQCLPVSGSHSVDCGSLISQRNFKMWMVGGCEAELAKVGDLAWQNLVKGCLAPRELLTQKHTPAYTSLKWIVSRILIPFCLEKGKYRLVRCLSRWPVILCCLWASISIAGAITVSWSFHRFDFSEVPEILDCLFLSDILWIHLFSAYLYTHHFLVGF